MKHKVPKGWEDDSVHWHLRKGKKPIAYSTKFCSELIGEFAKDGYTIKELRKVVIYDTEAQKVLDEYIKRGLGDEIAKNWFSRW